MNTNKTFIIAEAGVNHNGDLKLAKNLIEIAADAGADAVKFQTFKSNNIATKNAAKAKYQINDNKNENQFDMLSKLELSKADHLELINHCLKFKIKFMSSPFDEESIELLHDLKLDLFKIPSGEITNLPYLRKIATLKIPVIISTGMSTMDEISNCLRVFENNQYTNEMVSILHCTSSYPAEMKDINLNAMSTLKNHFSKYQIGYSDHTIGTEVSIAAVALGAKIIEKHFTLDKNLPGPDHKASLSPHELKYLITSIRNIEKALGTFEKKPMDNELETAKVARKSIVAKKFISKGDFFNTENLTTKRPGTGISPMQWDSIVGKKSHRNFEPDELIDL